MTSSVSASCKYIVTPFDLKNVMRSDGSAAHDPSSSSSADMIKDCQTTPPNSGGRSNDAERCSRSLDDMEDSKVWTLTHDSHVARRASSAIPVHCIEAESVGTALMMCVSRGTA